MPLIVAGHHFNIRVVVNCDFRKVSWDEISYKKEESAA